MKCPKCKTNIDYLHQYIETRFNFELDAEGNPFTLQAQPTEAEDYECPECHEALFDNQEDAIEFLKGR